MLYMVETDQGNLALYAKLFHLINHLVLRFVLVVRLLVVRASRTVSALFFVKHFSVSMLADESQQLLSIKGF
jgi:hypothetical protein